MSRNLFGIHVCASVNFGRYYRMKALPCPDELPSGALGNMTRFLFRGVIKSQKLDIGIIPLKDIVDRSREIYRPVKCWNDDPDRWIIIQRLIHGQMIIRFINYAPDGDGLLFGQGFPVRLTDFENNSTTLEMSRIAWKLQKNSKVLCVKKLLDLGKFCWPSKEFRTDNCKILCRGHKNEF